MTSFNTCERVGGISNGFLENSGSDSDSDDYRYERPAEAKFDGCPRVPAEERF